MVDLSRVYCHSIFNLLLYFTSQTKYPFHVHESARERIDVENSQLRYPNWFKLPTSSELANSSIESCVRYESSKALGKLWQYMQYKIDVITREGAG